jgi:gamma-glutamylcyclotransferase (GGCT)/AIG2-like uncharacterized protein YtfP
MKLFVYGTLLCGEKNHHVLDGATLLYTGTKLQAKMYDTGNGYPATELAIGSTIVGDIYEIHDHMWASLDDLEGFTGNPETDLYSKEIVSVGTIDGFIEAVVYTVCDESMKLLEIPSGDWIAYRQSFKQMK